MYTYSSQGQKKDHKMSQVIRCIKKENNTEKFRDKIIF